MPLRKTAIAAVREVRSKPAPSQLATLCSPHANLAVAREAHEQVKYQYYNFWPGLSILYLYCRNIEALQGSMQHLRTRAVLGHLDHGRGGMM